MAEDKTYTKEDLIDFGNYHRGKTLGEMINNNPQWVVFCLQSRKGFMIDYEARCKLKESFEFKYGFPLKENNDV